MEKITIKNFLNLSNIELNLSKINIIIGSQANGKSIIAKLIYFFKDFFNKYRSSIATKQKKADFDKHIILNFKEIFPEYSWRQQEFEIVYHLNNYYVGLFNKQTDNNKHNLSLEYSEYLVKIRRKLLLEYDKRSKSLEDIKKGKGSVRNTEDYLDEVFYEYVLKENQANSIDLLTFIPAGRSFFANLQSNVFSFISGGIPIDYFLAEFGSDYEFVKKIYEDRKFFQQEHNQAIDELISQIIVGNYVYEKGKDWIYSRYNNLKVNLSNSSSGQQEALPMILVLTSLPFWSSNRLFIIEEPEAHLFPKSQEHIVNLISLVFNATEKRHKFLITTHSPYILTAFNNLIQAGNTLKTLKQSSKYKSLKEKLFKVVPENKILDIEDVGAYAIKDGVIENIINPENKLIDNNVIDDVSNEFSNVFEELLEIEFGD